ncbi:hypothetical protein LXA43DRAFT_1176971 [Ganoderma leucocontextum]|nr:hypothetical protein LXA43DRAFT_1176971 [Ganoderma leucocontextum]
MSVHSFLPVFKTGVTPVTAINPVIDPVRSPPPRRLRKTRSIPDGLSSNGPGTEDVSPQPVTQTISRPHAHSVSSVDAFAPPIPQHAALENQAPRAPSGPGGDFFAEAMAWTNVHQSVIVVVTQGSSALSAQLLRGSRRVATLPERTM